MSEDKNDLKIVSTPWQKGILMICQKCGSTIDANKVAEPTKLAEKMRDELRADLRAAGKGQDLRVIVSGCLKVCEPNLQALALCKVDGSTKVVTFDPANGTKSVREFVKSEIE